MKQSKPAVTVLMPVYNAAHFLAPAIESILKQSLTDFEFLIIDDGSKDKSAAIIEEYKDKRIRFIRHKTNKKLITTLNEGIALAEAPLIARMDADDISAPDRLAKQVAFFRQHPKHVLVGSDFAIINEAGEVVSSEVTFSDDATIRLALAMTNTFAHGSVMMRTAAVREVGGYAPHAFLVEDYDLWLRLANVGQLANIAEPLYQWRLNSKGESTSGAQRQAKAARAIAQTIWDSYGTFGPPEELISTSTQAAQKNDSPARRRKMAELHIQLARERLKRGYRASAVRHAGTALRLCPQFLPFYFYSLVTILPASLFFKLENQAMTLMKKQRGW